MEFYLPLATIKFYISVGVGVLLFIFLLVIIRKLLLGKLDTTKRPDDHEHEEHD